MYYKLILVVILIIITSITYLLYNKYTKEGFLSDIVREDVNSYMNNKPIKDSRFSKYSSEYKHLHNVHTDKFFGVDNDLLIMNRCISYAGVDSDKLREDLKMKLQMSPMAFQVDEFYVNSKNTIDKRIINLIKQFYDKKVNILRYKNADEILNGPIYVLLFNAPYVGNIDANCEETTTTVQSNFHNRFSKYKVKPGVSYQVDSRCKNSKQNLDRDTKLLMFILYPTYNKDGKFVFKNWDNIKCNMQSILSTFEHNDSCFIGVNKTNLPGGCLNTKAPYKTECKVDKIVKIPYTVQEEYTVQEPYKYREPYTVTEKYTIKKKVPYYVNKLDCPEKPWVKFYHHVNFGGYEHKYEIDPKKEKVKNIDAREWNEYSSAKKSRCLSVDLFSHAKQKGNKLGTLFESTPYVLSLKNVRYRGRNAHDDIDSMTLRYKPKYVKVKKYKYIDIPKERTVTKYRDPVTKYKTVTKTRPVIKYREETRYDYERKNFGILYMLNTSSKMINSIVNGNLVRSLVNVSSSFSSPYVEEYCKNISKNPPKILNIIDSSSFSPDVPFKALRLAGRKKITLKEANLEDKSTKWKNVGDRYTNLGRHNVNCKNGSLVGFQLEKNKNGNKIRYIYRCSKNIDTGNGSKYNTLWNKSGNINDLKNVSYLTKHNVDCKNKPLKSFELKKKDKGFITDKIRYNYKCGNSALPKCEKRVSPKYKTIKSHKDLTKLKVYCKADEIMSGFKLHRIPYNKGKQPSRFKYEYTCCKTPEYVPKIIE